MIGNGVRRKNKETATKRGTIKKKYTRAKWNELTKKKKKKEEKDSRKERQLKWLNK